LQREREEGEEGEEGEGDEQETSEEEPPSQTGGRKHTKRSSSRKRPTYGDKMLAIESSSSVEMSYDSDSQEYNVAVRRSPNCSSAEKGRANSVENVMERIRAIYETLGKKCKPSLSELSTTDDSNLSAQYPYLSDKSLSVDEGYTRDAKGNDSPRNTYKEMMFVL